MFNFEVCAYLVKVKAREDFDRKNMLNILKIKIRTQRRDWLKGEVLQRSRSNFMHAQGDSFSDSRRVASNQHLLKVLGGK